MTTVAKSQLITDWITGLGWDVTQETGYPLYPGPEILASPDRAVFITPAGGPGWVTEEGALDAWSFQARLRGPAGNPIEPEAKAQELDLLLFTGAPATVDGVRIAAFTRSGSPPQPLPLDPASRRFEYTCTYVITTGA